ncbi:MAG: tetratricopeptide repeat protein [Subdoligranulum sp.]|nr:tetratricopeptide repeat protein [Subdoligranulum sp.]
MKKLKLMAVIPLAGGLLAAVVGLAFLLAGRGVTARPVRNADDYLADAGFYFEEGSYQNALYLYQRALELDENNADALRGVARAYDTMGYNDEAETAYENLTAQDSMEIDDWIALVKLKVANEKLDEARALVEKLVLTYEDESLQVMYDQMHLAAPAFNLSSGSYDAYQLLEAVFVPDGASVYYTLDGSDPTAQSPVFTGNIVMSEAVNTVKARAIGYMGYSSDVTELNIGITVPVEAVRVDRYSPVAYAVREIYPNKSYYDPIYNYEVAQIRSFYLIGGTCSAQQAPDYMFYDGYYTYSYDTSPRTYRGQGSIDGLQYAVFLKTAAISYQDRLSLEPLAELRYLEELSLLNNDLTDISALQNLGSLKRLALGWNRIEDVSPLAGLTNLTSLGLWNNNITDVGALRNLEHLKYFDISNNAVRDISVVGNMPELSSFWCNNNQVSDLSPLDGCAKLRILMQGNNPISNPGLWTQNAANLTKTDLQ